MKRYRLPFLGVIVCFAIIVFTAGVSAGEEVSSTGMSQAGKGNQTRLQAQIGRTEWAKEQLSQLLTKRKRPVGIKYYGNPRINNYANISELLRLIAGFESIHWDGNPPRELEYILFKSLTVLDDRIQVCPICKEIYLPFAALGNNPIKVIRSEKDKEFPFIVRFELMSFYFHAMDLADAQKFAEFMDIIQKPIQISWDERFEQFKVRAAEYRAMKTKPPVSEELRRFIVQANALTQKKEYARAIDVYRKAIEMDAVAYPPAYYNLALLCAQESRFNSAISYMKQYLLLGPDPQDARSGQDKIYEWELELGR
jgi:tetratricopeptide (TPR) repeat protein